MTKATSQHTDAELQAQDPVWHGGMLDKFPLRSASTGGTLWMTEHTAAAGTAPPMHRHTREDETYYIIEGAVRTYTDGVEELLTAGMAAFVPRGAVHSFKVESETARMLTIGTPGGMDQFFRDAGDPATSLDIPPRPDGPTPKLIAACETFGIEVLGPPPA